MMTCNRSHQHSLHPTVRLAMRSMTILSCCPVDEPICVSGCKSVRAYARLRVLGSVRVRPCIIVLAHSCTTCVYYVRVHTRLHAKCVYLWTCGGAYLHFLPVWSWIPPGILICIWHDLVPRCCSMRAKEGLHHIVLQLCPFPFHMFACYSCRIWLLNSLCPQAKGHIKWHAAVLRWGSQSDTVNS